MVGSKSPTSIPSTFKSKPFPLEGAASTAIFLVLISATPIVILPLSSEITVTSLFLPPILILLSSSFPVLSNKIVPLLLLACVFI